MLELKYKSEGLPNDKPRVYFTCHPDDFSHCFDEITDDILRLSECAIYYTEDMTQPITQEDHELQLERMSLFVVPVTLKLLIEPNRAMDEDVPYAITHTIPLLPIMLEPGLDPVYSREDKFSDRKYLMPSRDTDGSGLTYEEKLTRFLNAVLWDAETAKRIRAAFDCTVFLSYRWKDRYHADDLMRLIHKNPLFRDVATWYDEYLVPGEGFNAAIAEALDRSILYTMVVTGNLVAEENYIQTTEYPAARDLGKPVLPADMGLEESKKEQLAGMFIGIPECVSTKDEVLFYTTIQELLHNADVVLQGKSDDPEHNYLMGLAYLEGIDVEVDRERGLQLIISAAEKGLSEAMETLYKMYHDGKHVPLDYRLAHFWVERLEEHREQELGKEHPDTITALNNLAISYDEMGDHKRALELKEKVYNLRVEVLGEEHPHTLSALNNLAVTCSLLGDYKRALDLAERVYTMRIKLFGDEHPTTLSALDNLASICGRFGDIKRALELEEKAYSLFSLAKGEDHPDTLIALNNLAITYGELGDYEHELALEEQVCALRIKVLGEEHPKTLSALNNLAITCGKLGNYNRERELKETVCTLRVKVLGEEHPDTISTMIALASIYDKLGDHKRELELRKKVYFLCTKMLGEKHQNTLNAMICLAFTYGKVKDNQSRLELEEQLYTLFSEEFGEEHPDTLSALNNLVVTCREMGNYRRALELGEKSYAFCSQVFGEAHRFTLIALGNLALIHDDLGDHKYALELEEQLRSHWDKISISVETSDR